MFKDLDKNKDNMIEMEEWLEFWKRVRKAGYTEDDIRQELENILEGKSWAYFDLK